MSEFLCCFFFRVQYCTQYPYGTRYVAVPAGSSRPVDTVRYVGKACWIIGKRNTCRLPTVAHVSDFLVWGVNFGWCSVQNGVSFLIFFFENVRTREIHLIEILRTAQYTFTVRCLIFSIAECTYCVAQYTTQYCVWNCRMDNKTAGGSLKKKKMTSRDPGNPS